MTSGLEILPTEAARLLDDLTAIVARACAKIRAVPPAAFDAATQGPTNRPVTAADEESEAAILQGVARLMPNVPVAFRGNCRRPSTFDGSFVIVDPLDGTREFLAGRDEFTVNLALVTRGVPVAGIIAAPKRGKVWRGVSGVKAERLRLLDDGADQPEAIRTRVWRPPKPNRSCQPFTFRCNHRRFPGFTRIDHTKCQRLGN